MLRVYTRMLGPQYDVTTALGGRAAMKVLEREKNGFEAIVADLAMPEVNGIALHAWVREHAPPLVRRMLFITGGATAPHEEEFLASLSTPWLHKPFEATDLLRRVADLVGGRAARPDSP